MGNTINPNILFVFSGVALGKYIFEQNPASMDSVAMKNYSNTLPLLIGEDIYQRPLYDNEVRRMSWDITSYAHYMALKDYSTRDSYGNIPLTYFWDGTVYGFQGAPIHVLDVYGVPIAGKFNQWKVEIQFKPAALFDNTGAI